jgi:hypothetical protein
MIVQAVLGGFAGLVVAVKMFGRRLKSFIFFWRKPEPEDSPSAAPVVTEAAPVEPKP